MLGMRRILTWVRAQGGLFMPGHSMKLQLLAAASLAIVATASASSQAPNVAGQTPPPTSEHLQNMESEMINIRAESEQLGGQPTPGGSLNNVQTRINELDQAIERTEGVAEEVGASAEDLNRLREQYGDTTIFGLSDAVEEVGEQGVEKVGEYCLTRWCSKLAGKALGWVALAGDVVEYGGKFIIREINEERLRDLVRSERVKLSDLYELLRTMRCEQSAERAKVRRLEQLRARERFLFREIAAERQRIAQRPRRQASRAAVQRRETDYPGDLEEWEKHKANPPTRRLEVTPAAPSSQAMKLSPFARDVLASHNAERTRYGAPPLQWNTTLEATATAYASQLAATGQRVHASREGRGIERENLSQGLLGWNTNQMMASWVGEKQHFTPGTFPNVCAGDWSRCGHYTQMIWPTTTDIGCGMARGSGYSWLVCRYSPGGNKDGQLVGKPVDQRLAMRATRPC